jgi:hypothetical protein
MIIISIITAIAKWADPLATAEIWLYLFHLYSELIGAKSRRFSL